MLISVVREWGVWLNLGVVVVVEMIIQHMQASIPHHISKTFGEYLQN